MANVLLHTLLVSVTRLLQQKHSKEWLERATQLLDLLNHSFALCNSTIFVNDNLIPVSDALVSILNDRSLIETNRYMFKSVIYLLLTLINNSDMVLKRVKRQQEIFLQLTDIEGEAYLVLATLVDDNEIMTMMNRNEKCAFVIQQYLKQQNIEENSRLTSLTKRLKSELKTN